MVFRGVKIPVKRKKSIEKSSFSLSLNLLLRCSGAGNEGGGGGAGVQGCKKSG